MHLTDAQQAAFASDGFLVVRGLITPEEASGLVDDYDGLASGRIRHATWNGRDGEAGAPGMRQIPFPSLVLEAWQDHAYRRRALEAARELLGEELDYFFDQLFMKPAQCPAEVPWHQDAAYWGDVGSGVTCWLALSEVTEQHGCMEFVRGSHQGDILPHGKAALDDQYAANPEMARNHLSLQGAPAGEVVRAPLGPGDATFHHYKTLHRSGGNATATPRRGLATHFTLPSPRLGRHMARLADYARSLGGPVPD